eukprot:TRINITY_DN7857_c1_g1_i1.p1 TRINITY_DN7857_c1_g1~~TRINITY_DN7857_c1_g1_i1.p1  ORF type:complete len:326 (+),score=177.04 TRINITY_DN7857_c1_g1_i1:57-1034(+)
MASIKETIKFISENEVEQILNMNELIDCIEQTLKSFSIEQKENVQPIRSVITIEKYNGYFGCMPALTANGHLGIKLVTWYPDNYIKSIPTHQAQILLFNSQNGSLLAMLGGEVVTEKRTAAASAVATKWLSDTNSQILSIIGSGVQARSHIEALLLVRPFKFIKIWSRTKANAEKLSQTCKTVNMKGENVIISIHDTIEQAVENADVIVTVTSSSIPVLKASTIKQGAHINVVGACRPTWREVDDETMLNSAVYVDSKEGALKESGDIILSGAIIAGEIGEIIGQSIINPRSLELQKQPKFTLFKSLGMGLEDVAAASLVLSKLN